MSDTSPLILIIENNSKHLDDIDKFLSKHNFWTSKASNGTEGTVIAIEKLPDCILFDNNMPDMTGRNFCRTIKKYETLKDIPVILLSGNESTDLVIAGLKEGASDYFKKSTDRRLLVEKITNVLENKTIQKHADDLSQKNDDFLELFSQEIFESLSSVKKIFQEISETVCNHENNECNSLVVRGLHRSDRALEMIHDVLEIGHLEDKFTLSMERFRVSDIIHSCLSDFSHEIREKEIQVGISLDEDIRIRADKKLLSDVICNLFDNALHHAPEKGNLEVSVSSDIYKLPNMQPDRYLTFSMYNNGPQIPDTMLKNIFDKYEEIKYSDEFGGGGLGLAISKMICRLHKGDIYADSDEKGATFTFRIPGIVDDKATVLVVDNDSSTRLVVRKILEKAGFYVDEADNGKIALARMESDKPDIVILDMEMPELDGLETVREIRSTEHLMDVPIILHSNKMDADDMAEVSSLAQDVIYKPAEDNEIEEKILNTLNIQRDPDRENVLLLDHPDIDNEFIQMILEELGFSVMNAKNFIEAVFFLNKYCFSVAIMEADLPGIDYSELMELIGPSSSDIPLLLLVEKQDVEKYKREASFAKGLLVKPVSQKAFKDAVAKYKKSC